MEEKIELWQIAQALEERFPLSTQESWDNSGLQIGSPGSVVSGAVLALDICDEVIDKALEAGTNLIITHHPLLFNPIKSVTDCTPKGKMIMRLIRENINVYSLHTPIDKGEGGMNDWIAEKLGLVDPIHGEDGFPVTGALRKPMKPDEFVALLKDVFGLKYVEADFSYSNDIRVVAICSGSGMSTAETAAEQGADTLITGDIRWGGYTDWHGRMNICNITHFHSEKHFAQIASCVIKKNFPKFALQTMNVNITEYW